MLVVVPLDPPTADLAEHALERVGDDLPKRALADLYRATAIDVIRAVASSGGDLLINYRDAETLPETATDIDDPKGAVRSLTEEAIGDVTGVRFERQVGSTRSARIGNTVTHLLEREGVQSVAVLEPTAPLVERTEIDGIAMALRRKDVVLGPAGTGELYVSAFAEPIDFTDVYEHQPIERVARAAADGATDLRVGFAPRVPLVSTPAGLRGTVLEMAARQTTDHPVPRATAEAVATFDELGV